MVFIGYLSILGRHFLWEQKFKNGQNRGILSSVVVKYILFIYIGNYSYTNNLYSK